MSMKGKIFVSSEMRKSRIPMKCERNVINGRGERRMGGDEIKLICFVIYYLNVCII